MFYVVVFTLLAVSNLLPSSLSISNNYFFSFKFLLSADENDEINVSPSNKDCNKWLNHHEKKLLDKEEKRDERNDDNYKIFHNSAFN